MLSYEFETLDPQKPGQIKDVLVEVPVEVELGDPAALQKFYDDHRALYPEPSLDERVAAGRITEKFAEALRKQGVK